MSVSCSLSQNGSERFQKENRTELPYWKSGTFFYFGHYRTWNESSIEANSVSDHSSGHYFTTLSCICPIKMKCLSEWIVSGKIRRCSVFENKMFDWMIWRSFLYINLIEPLQGLFNQHYFERKSGGLPLVFMPSPSWGRAVIIAVSCSLHSPCFFQLLSLSLWRVTLTLGHWVMCHSCGVSFPMLEHYYPSFVPMTANRLLPPHQAPHSAPLQSLLLVIC